jgi:hypothetical protein
VGGDFIDSFRYLNQLGSLAKLGVQVVIHNTLAASDYALVDETTLVPRPNYWSALLWCRLMGTTVLDAGASPSPDLHLYAHCLRNHPGGVALLAINADRAKHAGASSSSEVTCHNLLENPRLPDLLHLHRQASHSSPSPMLEMQVAGRETYRSFSTR